MKKVLVIIPAYNCGYSLKPILGQIRNISSEISNKYAISIIVIDDGSTDETTKLISEFDVEKVRHKVNKGLGASLFEGYRFFLRGDYDYLITLDADGQHDPAYIPLLLEKLDNGIDLVFASRYSHESAMIGTPLDRKILNIYANNLIFQFTNYNISDPLTGFKGYQRSLISDLMKLKLIAKKYCSCIEEIIKFSKLYGSNLKYSEVSHPAIYKSNKYKKLVLKYRKSDYKNRLNRIIEVSDIALKTIQQIRKN